MDKIYDVRFRLDNLDCNFFLGYRVGEPWKTETDRFRYYSEEDIGVDKSPVTNLLELTNNHPRLSEIKQSFLITAERVPPFESFIGNIENNTKEVLAVCLISKNEKGFYEVSDFTKLNPNFTE